MKHKSTCETRRRGDKDEARVSCTCGFTGLWVPRKRVTFDRKLGQWVYKA